MANQTEKTVTNPRQNAAETMRDVLLEFGNTEHITKPDDFDFAQAHLISLTSNREIKNLTEDHRAAAEYLKPARRKGTASLQDLNSLIAWANRFKGDTSALFANPDMSNPLLTCIADYHAAGSIDVSDVTGDPTARHCHHRAKYGFPLSDEWKAWMQVSTGNQGEPMLLEKDDLGEFIEAQAKDIMDPTPAIIAGKHDDKNDPWENRLIETARKIEGRFGQLTQLLAMSKQFQVFETSDLQLKTNRDTGEQEIQFLNEHKTADGSPLKIPNLLIIAIPVFKGGAPYRMCVRFRYRKAGGTVRFILKVYNPEKAFEAAFTEAIDQATEETGLPTFMGAPEA